MMNESEVFYTFSTAAEYGGGFYSLLGKAGLKADPSNKAKLLLAFPELKQTYGPASLLHRHLRNVAI